MDVKKTLLAIALSATAVTSAYAQKGTLVTGNSLASTSCMINAGALICWGANDYGQLGDGTIFPGIFPQTIITTGVTQVAMASDFSISMDPVDLDGAHTCAVVGTSLMCWGSNTYGQLGDGSTGSFLPKKVAVWADKNNPAFSALTTVQKDIAALATGNTLAVTSVAVGSQHTCVTFTGGLGKCWGNNNQGQLGYGIVGDIDTSNPSIFDGTHYAGVTLDGVSNLNTSAALMPVYRHKAYNATTVALNGAGILKSVLKFTAGISHTCMSTGVIPTPDDDTYIDNNTIATVRCFGDNDAGQLGNMETIGGTNANLGALVSEYDGATPIYASVAGTTIHSVKAGGRHTCIAVSSAGEFTNALFCTGANDAGQLGNSDTGTNQPLPVATMGDGVTAYEVGAAHTCFIRLGALKCMGMSLYGQLGNGSVDNDPTQDWVPRTVLGGRSNVQQISIGAIHTCGAFGPAATAVVKCWGNNMYGAVGDGRDAGDNADFPLVLTPSNVAF